MYGAVVGVCWGLAAFFAVAVARAVTDGAVPHLGYDSHAYWHAWRQHLYNQSPDMQFNRFLYSPLFAQLIWPLTKLPWPVFVTVWSVVTAAIFLWLLWPVRQVWRVPLFVFLCLHEVFVGNINALLAAMVVLGFRYPGLWAFALLTKVAPGVGLLWFALRRDWRSLGVVAATTSLLASVSLIAAPGLWRQWLRLLTSGRVATQTLLPYWLQLVVAVMIVSIAARSNRGWLLPVGMLLTLPVAGSVLTLSVLAAIPRLRATGSDGLKDNNTEGDVRACASLARGSS